MTDPLDEETRLRVALSELHRQYQAAAKPYIDRLVEIEMRKPPKPIIFDPKGELFY